MNRYRDLNEYLHSKQHSDPAYFSDLKRNRVEQSQVPIKTRAPFGVREKLAGEFVVYDNAGWPMIEEQTGEPLTRDIAEHFCKALNMLYAADLLNGSDEVKDKDPYPAHLSPRTKPSKNPFV